MWYAIAAGIIVIVITVLCDKDRARFRDLELRFKSDDIDEVTGALYDAHDWLERISESFKHASLLAQTNFNPKMAFNSASSENAEYAAQLKDRFNSVLKKLQKIGIDFDPEDFDSRLFE